MANIESAVKLLAQWHTALRCALHDYARPNDLIVMHISVAKLGDYHANGTGMLHRIRLNIPVDNILNCEIIKNAKDRCKNSDITNDPVILNKITHFLNEQNFNTLEPISKSATMVFYRDSYGENRKAVVWESLSQIDALIKAKRCELQKYDNQRPTPKASRQEQQLTPGKV